MTVFYIFLKVGLFFYIFIYARTFILFDVVLYTAKNIKRNKDNFNEQLLGRKIVRKKFVEFYTVAVLKNKLLDYSKRKLDIHIANID